MRDLRFRIVSSTEPCEEYIADAIESKLRSGQKVLWLLSGGSAVGVQSKVAGKLSKVDLSNLTVSLADERFGPVGHTESIWQQMKDAGFKMPGATLLPVLNGKDIENCTAEWGQALEEALANADYKLAVFGIGPDGHTAGILPHSPAARPHEKLVFAYQSEAIPGVRPAFERITITDKVFPLLSEAVILAMGESKKAPLEALASELPTEDQPAQLLKKVPKVIIFNDQIGDRQ